MTMPDRKFNQRKSFRCSVPESQQQAELRVGRRRFTVRLFNESSGGFAALSDRDPGVAEGDMVTLVTSCSRYELRVAHAAAIENTPEDGQGTGIVFRVGLEMVHELATMPGGQTAQCRGQWRNFLPINTLMIGGSVALVATLLIGLAVVLANLDTAWVGKLAFWQSGHSRAAAGQKEMFTQVATQLGLNRSQQTQLTDIASQTVDTLQALDAVWKNDPPEVRLHKQALLLEAAKAEILRLLSADQRGRWQALME